MLLSSLTTAPPVRFPTGRTASVKKEAIAAHAVDLVHIRNGEAPVVPASPAPPPRRLRMGHFSDTGPANGPVVTTATGNAVDVLTGQVHAVLCALVPGADAEIQAAIEQLQMHPDARRKPSIERRVRHLLNAFPRAHCARQQMLRTAALVLSRAADAEQLLAYQVDKHGRQQAQNHYPGAHLETSRGVSLGIAAGVPRIGEASLTGSAQRTHSTSTYDDLAVAHFSTTTFTGRAAIEAGLPAEVAAGAHAAAHITRGTGKVDDKMQDHVLALARASVARRLGGNRLLRIAKRVIGPRRDRYAERMSTALAWQTRLPMLLGHSAPLRTPRFHPAPPVPIPATLHTVGGELGAHAGIALLDAGFSARAARTEVTINLPLRLTDTSAEACAARQQIMVQRRLDERLAHLLKGQARPRSLTLQLVQRLRSSPTATRALATRLDAVDYLGAEFDHLEALFRHAIQAPRQAAPPLASLSRDWGGDGRHIEPVMVHMLDTLAWLQATPAPEAADADRDHWERLQQGVQQLANRIHDSSIPHDRQRVHEATHAIRPMTQRVASRQGTVGLVSSLGLPGLDAAARASVSRIERDDPDPLRAGTYIDLTLTGELTPALGELLAQVQRSLPGTSDGLPTEQIEHVLMHLSPSFPSTLNAQCVVRLFRPRFQQEPGFPAWCKGTHLQAVRLSAGSAQGVNLIAPVPVAPGILIKPGVHYQRTEQVPQMEWLHDGTLTGPLLRYISLRAPGRDEAATWATMLERHGADVDRLALALAVPGSVAAGEARYWLNREVGQEGPSRAQRAALAQLTRLGHLQDPEARRAQMHRLFLALSEVTLRAKRASPLIGPAVLPPSPLR